MKCPNLTIIALSSNHHQHCNGSESGYREVMVAQLRAVLEGGRGRARADSLCEDAELEVLVLETQRRTMRPKPKGDVAEGEWALCLLRWRRECVYMLRAKHQRTARGSEPGERESG